MGRTRRCGWFPEGGSRDLRFGNPEAEFEFEILETNFWVSDLRPLLYSVSIHNISSAAFEHTKACSWKLIDLISRSERQVTNSESRILEFGFKLPASDFRDLYCPQKQRTMAHIQQLRVYRNLSFLEDFSQNDLKP